MANRVLVSGYGAVTPFGVGAGVSFAGLLEGRGAYSENHDLDLSDPSFHQRKIAHVPSGFLASEFPEVYASAQATKMTLAAMEEALGMSRLGVPVLPKTRIGIAVTTLESAVLEEIALAGTGGADASRLFEIVDPEFCVRHIRRLTGARGPSMVLSNACASGNHAIAAGFDMISSGEVDIAIVGGGCKIFRSAVAGFHQFRGMAGETCRPFDKSRSGAMLGDGAGILILENEAHAEARGFRAGLVVSGYGTSCDAYDMIMQHPDGLGMALCMERALAMSRLDPGQIQYINAHGTGTPLNDRLETASIKRLFGEHSRNLVVTSTKALLGHNLYAASATEAVWCCCVIDSGRVPGTWNFQEPDPECDLDYAHSGSRSAIVENCINNSFGFGGSNASVVFSRN